MPSLTVTTTATVTRIADLDRLKERLGLSTQSSQDSYLGDLLDEATAAIESYCHRTFGKQTYTETLPSDSQHKIMLSEFPVLSTTVTITDTISSTTLSSTEWEIDTRSGIITIPWGAPASLTYRGDIVKSQYARSDRDRWSVVYTAGYNLSTGSSGNVPTDLRRAALVTAEFYYNSGSLNPSSTRYRKIRLDDFEVQSFSRFESQTFGSWGIPEEAAQLADPYVKDW